MRITLNTIDKVYKAKQCSIEVMEALGYTLIENVMVDNSGFGSEDEYADTPRQFEARLRRMFEDYDTLTAKITGVGQFQVYIGLFTKTGVKTGRVLASNTYLLNIGGKRVVRLYDTDIITDNGDGTLTLYTGGYNTMTTSKRMAQFTNLYINRKNWVMHANGTPFENDSLTIEGTLNV